MNLTTVAKHIMRKGSMTFTNYSPEILMGVGTAAFVGTIFLAVKAAPTIQEEYEYAVNTSYRRGMSKPKQIFYVSSKVIPAAAPTILMGASALACFFGAHRIQTKRQVALAGLYSMASKTLESYQQKVIEDVGESKHLSIVDRVLDDDEKPEINEDNEYEGPGDTLIYDRVTNRWFKSSPERIKEAEGKVATRLLTEMYVPLNYFYQELGLDDNSFVGEAIGWDVNGCHMDLMFRAGLDETNRPYTIIMYNTTILDENALRAR